MSSSLQFSKVSSSVPKSSSSVRDILGSGLDSVVLWTGVWEKWTVVNYMMVSVRCIMFVILEF